MLSFNAKNFKKIPFLRLLIALIAGILVQQNFQLSITPVVFTTIILVILFFVHKALVKSNEYVFRWLNGSLILSI
ncbi:MAG: hypothetical protein LBE82_01535, partial [Chitinophagaceae bacterium]|nr:hypothetical protein [Chitinophagaceae bacterium]